MAGARPAAAQRASAAATIGCNWLLSSRAAAALAAGAPAAISELTGMMRMPSMQIAPSVGLFHVETCSTLLVIVKVPRLCHATPWSVEPLGALRSLTTPDER